LRPIIVDTCALVMLIRIVPKMLKDDRFNCVTIRSIRDEFIRTSKFKDKYPWRKKLTGEIDTIGTTHEAKTEVNLNKKVIDRMILEGVENKKTGKIFDLSKTDRELLAWALVLKRYLVSGDGNIGEFGHQEFSSIFIGHLSPLELLNDWIEHKLLVWDDKLQLYLEDWQKNEEKSQSSCQIARFETLTEYPYVGS